MAVLKDCHQRLPKVLCGGVLWWCLCGGVFVVVSCVGVFCGGVFFAVVFLWWCSESSAEVMAVLKDCHPRLPKVLLK